MPSQCSAEARAFGISNGCSAADPPKILATQARGWCSVQSWTKDHGVESRNINLSLSISVYSLDPLRLGFELCLMAWRGALMHLTALTPHEPCASRTSARPFRRWSTGHPPGRERSVTRETIRRNFRDRAANFLEM